MTSFSAEQKQIAMLLVDGPKTVESLNKHLDIPYDQLMRELKGMLKLKLVEKTEGFPTKYSLKDEISEEIRKRRQLAETDKFELRLHAMIEFQAIEHDLLKKHMGKLAEALQKEADFTVYSCNKQPIIKNEENYSSYLDIILSVKNFKSLVRFMYFYGPSSIEVLKPGKLEIKADDLQDGLVDMAEMIQAYAQYIAKMMNRQELEEFNKRLFG